MYKNILITTDGSDLSNKAVAHGVALAKSVGAKVTALTVTVPIPVMLVDPNAIAALPDDFEESLRAAGADDLAKVAAAAKAAGVPCETVQAEGSEPFREIIDTAKKKGCDLIVMASHGRRGVSAVVLGSETVKVLTHSKVPVLVCR